jgi:hypothetical protein
VVDDLIAGAQGLDIWGSSKVQDAIWATMFAQVAAQGETGEFASILGSTGGGDRLLIVYNHDRFEVVRQFELPHINIEGRVRAPLVAHFRLKPAGPEFLFMVNHLYRGNAPAQHEQARLLNAWPREQSLPVIAVGDYNFDWDVMNGETVHDQGYDLLTADGSFAWIWPAHLIRTQCLLNSILDLCSWRERPNAGAPPPRSWRLTSVIIPPTRAGAIIGRCSRKSSSPATASPVPGNSSSRISSASRRS